jgi:hypothetical protein
MPGGACCHLLKGVGGSMRCQLLLLLQGYWPCASSGCCCWLCHHICIIIIEQVSKPVHVNLCVTTTWLHLARSWACIWPTSWPSCILDLALTQ